MKFKRILFLLPCLMVVPTLTSSCTNTTMVKEEKGYISKTLYMEIENLLIEAHNPTNPNNPYYPQNITQEQKEENLKKLQNYLNEEYFKGDLIKIENKDLIFNKDVELENKGFILVKSVSNYIKQVCYLMFDKKTIRFNINVW